MTTCRPAVVARVVALVGVTLAGVAVSGCVAPKQPTVDPRPYSDVFGYCFTTFGSHVLSTAMNKAGTTMLYLTAAQPSTLPSHQWQSGDRAVLLQNFDSGQGRHIVLTWNPVGTAPVNATKSPNAQATARPYGYNEQMIGLAMSETGERFVVAVRRAEVNGPIGKLYAGVVPPLDGNAVLAPGQGLSLVPVNDYEATEGLRSFALSPDGTKLAAVVGNQGEVRLYDFTKQPDQALTVFTKGPKDAVVVSHELPKRSSVSMTSDRTPAVANIGQMLVTWSPQGDQLAIATGLTAGDATLALMNPTTGKLVGVRRFKDSTVPQVAWAADGKSLFVMTTEIRSSGTVFGNTAFQRVAAAEGGEDIAHGGQIEQPAGYRTEPANLVNFGDDQRFLLTWQGGLWRFIAPGGDLTKGVLRRVSADARVPYLPPSVSMDKDVALFVGATKSGQYATVRSDVSQNSCP